jgi:hypothetical protein
MALKEDFNKLSCLFNDPGFNATVNDEKLPYFVPLSTILNLLKSTKSDSTSDYTCEESF